MPRALNTPAQLRAQLRQNRQRKYIGKRHLGSKTRRRNEETTAACHSWFFLYCAKENEPVESPGSFAAVRRGIKSGTTRAYSLKDAPWRMWSSCASRRITME